MIDTRGSAPSLELLPSQKRMYDQFINESADMVIGEYPQYSQMHNSNSQLVKLRAKSLSLGHLNQKLGFSSVVVTSKSPEQIRKQRYQLGNKQMLNQIAMLQQQCDKFGGSEYIKDQMKRQKISSQQLSKFYEQRIKSIHGFTSLPKINYRAKINQQSSNLPKLRHKKLQEIRHQYSKWYLDSDKRALYHQQEPQNIKRVTKYVQKLFNNHNNNVVIKKQFVPLLIKQSTLKLGRQPIVCSYAVIKRR